MNLRQQRSVDDAAHLTSAALDRLRLVEEHQALDRKPRLVADHGESADCARDHWRQRIVWQGVALWLEVPP